MSAFTATSAPSASPFNCAVTAALPFGGAEILILSLVFLALIVTYCVTFFDVGLKQMWPATFLDPAVAARVAQIQKQFPALGQATTAATATVADETEADETTAFVEVVKPLDPKTPVQYTTAVATDPYIAGRSIDEDLIHILANNDAFSTVSSYCSSTVRGYAMLSAILMSAGISLSYLWTHNALVDPKAGDWIGKIAILGYVMVFFTATIMCGSNGHSVYRNANIALFSNISTSPSSSLLKFHTFGIVCFCLLPMIAHLLRVLTEGPSMPNYAGAWAGISAQLTGAVMFAVGSWIGGRCGVSQVMGNKLSILAEIYVVFASFAAFVQYEFYATAVCANYLTGFNSAIGAAFAVPLARLCLKHYAAAPTSFPTSASLLLLNNGQPVATAGTCAALSFDGQHVQSLPHLQLADE